MKNTILMNAQEVAEELGVSKASAYKMIHVWNEKLQKMGYAHLFPDKQTEMANRLDDEWTKKGERTCPEK